MTPKLVRAAVWSSAEVRAWVDRHSGNVSACARRLRVHRTELQDWIAGDRDIPPRVQAHMETLDQYEPGKGYSRA